MSAKDILLKPISATEANTFVRKHHYSGKVVSNSQIHIGIYYFGKLEGVMQYGPSLDKKKCIGLVADTAWGGFIELNRMVFTDVLPRNSESRAIGISLKILKKHLPQLEWVISFADGTTCGDGTIYRASGFALTSIKKNSGLRQNPANGEVMQNMTAFSRNIEKEFRTWPLVNGFQFRYIYFFGDNVRKRLTVKEIPFGEIAVKGATMYKGLRPESITSDATSIHEVDGGATPTSGL